MEGRAVSGRQNNQSVCALLIYLTLTAYISEVLMHGTELFGMCVCLCPRVSLTFPHIQFLISSLLPPHMRRLDQGLHITSTLAHLSYQI